MIFFFQTVDVPPDRGIVLSVVDTEHKPPDKIGDDGLNQFDICIQLLDEHLFYVFDQAD